MDIHIVPDGRLVIAGVLLLVVIGLAILLPQAAPAPPLARPPIQAGNASVTLAVLAQHASATNCWSVIDGTVYNLTSYIDRHPGGRREILKACGIDATTLFATQDGAGQHSSRAWDLLAGFAIGSLANDSDATPAPPLSAPPAPPLITPTLEPATPPSADPVSEPAGLTLDDVSAHRTADDCWIVVQGGVYNVTPFIPYHPGGRRAIERVCGTDATVAFETKGGGGSHSSSAWNLLASYRIGTLAGSTAAPATPPMGTNDGGEYDD